MINTVSIALATYNGGLYLNKQIDSILCQDYPVFEIIVCDDCSSDSTQEILIKYKEKFPDLFKIIYNEQNIGYVRNFEKALSYCTGDFIALSDQDDLWDTNKISILLSNIHRNDLIHSDARLIDINDAVLVKSFTKHIKKSIQNTSFLQLCTNNQVTGCTAMITRSLRDKAMPFPSGMMHDHWLAVLAKDNNGIMYYPGCLISYRQHDNNAIGGLVDKSTNKSNKKNIDAVFKSRIRRYDDYLNNFYGRISKSHLREIAGIRDYYVSYFTHVFRFEAAFFYLFHLNVFGYNKKAIQVINNFIKSFFGIGYKKV